MIDDHERRIDALELQLAETHRIATSAGHELRENKGRIAALEESARQMTGDLALLRNDWGHLNSLLIEIKEQGKANADAIKDNAESTNSIIMHIDAMKSNWMNQLIILAVTGAGAVLMAVWLQIAK